MAIPIIKNWKDYYIDHDEGLGSSYERVVLNLKLLSLCQQHKVESILEAPTFGFTGISGINSIYPAQKGITVNLIDHDKSRLDYIKRTWKELDLDVNLLYSSEYNNLPLTDKSIDLSWNFSALWFVQDLKKFFEELSRITKKVIVICVPNRAGIGYLIQKYLGKKDMKKFLTEEYIFPKNIIENMKDLGWQLIEKDFIDNPPWPDIGMHKEKFLKTIGLSFLVKEQKREPLSILNFYNGKEPDFQTKMLKYFWFEKKSPRIVKRFWSHHRYFIFIKSHEKE